MKAWLDHEMGTGLKTKRQVYEAGIEWGFQENQGYQ